MKIKSITEEEITFDNGNTITFAHEQDCCEHNYADFTHLEKEVEEEEFDEDLLFESVDGKGFRFGNKGGYKYFVPCYSCQNGWYSSAIDVYYKRADREGEFSITLICEEVID